MPKPILATLTSLGLLTLAVLAPAARADHGCSDERVSLPDGPGSIGGVGDNVDVNANMGAMSTHVPIEVPPGFGGMTPALALDYSSGSGSGEVGYGWSLPVSSIERMRMRGLPVYDETDEIVVDGGSELVRTGDLDGSAVYRMRFEGSFVRYRWHAREGGASGYWTAERPDGSIAYYGADEAGTPVRAARVQTPAGQVYRWHLVAVLDRFGHAMRYAYAKDGEHSLLDEVTYAHGAGGQARYSVRFGYEARPDPITTGEPGFLLALGQRLSEIRVNAGPETIRRYELTYEDLATSGGASRLARVEIRGRDGSLSPVRFTYEYSRSLDGVCPGECQGPFVVDMGSLPAGVDVRSGRATLIDMNGDALPDIVGTGPDGRHTIVLSRMDPDTGVPSFAAAYPSAATAAGGSFILNSPGVQVLDVDGDGFVDMIDSRNSLVLCNEGTGDWSGSACLMNSSLPEMDPDADGDANPLHVRFLDYDDDRRIDVIRTGVGITEVFVNTGSEFVPVTVEDIGAVFDDSPTLQLADLNGDGLQDPVEILTATQLRYRLNLGYGRWTPWTTRSITGFGASDLELIQIEDINGDGMADLVLVAGTELRYAINRGDRFDDAVTLTSAGVTGELPERVPDSTVVLFADMNGNGSRDVVWVNGSQVSFLEMFPTRPNLISRVENGIGSVQEIEYGSSVLEQARDLGTADEWIERLPIPMNVVVALDLWERLTGTEEGGLHDRTEMSYHAGFYDGVERVFRGFARVERLQRADLEVDFEEGSLAVMEFDVGASDPHRAGRLLHEAVFGGEPGAWRPIRETWTTYEDCPLADVPSAGLARPVRFVCETRKETTLQEGADEAAWATTRSSTERDGWGQVVRSTEEGVVHMGPPSSPSPCGECTTGACGAECRGDEAVIETEYVDPGAATGGAWILGRPVRVVRHGGGAGPRAETVYRYDGPDFVGLPEGGLTRGAVTSVRVRVSEGDDWIWTTRVRRDEHGHVVEQILPRGEMSVTDDHRREITYDGDGLRLVRQDVLFHDGAGQPSRLRQEIAYEPAFGEPVEETAWMLVRDGTTLTARSSRRTRYDAFARPSAMLLPGDADAAPSSEYTYEIGSPVSRVIIRGRVTSGGPLVTEEIRCIDGMGRQVQTRTRVAAGDYQVSEHVELNRAGRVIRQYQAYRSPSAACDAAPPATGYVQYTYDSQGRPSTVTLPDEEVYGTRSALRYEYLPLGARTFDAEDTDASSAHAMTPMARLFDGLGRTVSISRDLGGGELATTELRYDGLGRLVTVVDPLGEVHEQAYDLAGRVISASDPSTGTTTYTFDADGHVIERRDARGARVATEYDALGRVVAQWDPTDEAGTRAALTYDLDESCDECENGAGKLVSVTYPLGELGTGRDEVGYDARGHTVFEARTVEGHRYVFGHEYDVAGRLLRSSLPGGIVLERSYDDASRLIAIDGVADAITYEQRGSVASVFYANGTRTERSYDGATRLERLETRASDLVLQGRLYERDRAGNILAIEDTSDPGTGLAPRSLAAAFEYDAWYRLRGARYGEGDAAEALTMDYDLGDRILRRESSLSLASRAHVGTYEYDPNRPEQLLAAGERTYGYDAAGYVTERSGTRLDWDYAGRLAGARSDAGEARDGRFLYGAGSARVAKLERGGVTLYLSPEVEVRDGVVYVYPQVGSARLARLRTSAIQTEVLSDVAPLGAPEGEINAADAWVAHASAAGIVSGAGDASEPARLLRGAARRLLSLDGGELAYLHHDHLGSVTLATDADGSPIGETLYYPGGEVRHRSGFTDEHGFTGQEQDESTGLHAFRHRHLDAAVGRWMSADPAFAVLSPDSIEGSLADAGSIYAYVGNHLINATDPTGLSQTPAPGGGGQAARPPLRERVKTFLARSQTWANFKASFRGVSLGLKVAGVAGTVAVSVLTGGAPVAIVLAGVVGATTTAAVALAGARIKTMVTNRRAAALDRRHALRQNPNAVARSSRWRNALWNFGVPVGVAVGVGIVVGVLGPAAALSLAASSPVDLSHIGSGASVAHELTGNAIEGSRDGHMRYQLDVAARNAPFEGAAGARAFTAATAPAQPPTQDWLQAVMGR